jgi:4-alpha-glucanotransferase
MKKEISNNRIGHGGMDFVMIYRLISCLNRGLSLDIDVYDSVLWSSIVPLSELSVLNKSKTINIPDFTGGNWKNSRKTELLRVI